MLDEQTGLLTLLSEFDSICRKHNITYYLEGGSLLGAVRHKGFLPWDDDIDLCITRKNWNKLLEVLDEELPKNRELFCYERYPEYLRETNKYTNLDTTVLFCNHVLDGLAAGQHIDLFILDPAPSDPVKFEEYKALACVYSELMTPVYVLCNDIINHHDLYKKYLRMMKKKGRNYVLDLIQEKMLSYADDETCDTYYIRWGKLHRFFDKEIFGTPVDVEFEGGLYMAPQKYHRFLRAQFGDEWMMVPTEMHQESHNTFDNYKVPCSVFMDDYTPFIDFTEARAAYKKKKKHNIERIKINHELERHFSQAISDLHSDSMAGRKFSLSEEARKNMADGKYRKVLEYLDPYISNQLSPLLIKHGLAVEVSEDVFSAAIQALVMVGRLRDAERIISLNRNNSLGSSERAKHFTEVINDVRSCMIANEETRYADAYQTAEKWLSVYPLQSNLAVFLIKHNIRCGKPAEELLAQTEDLLRHYPQNDELMKFMGDFLTQTGDEAKAREWYRKCAESTRNGLIMMELVDSGICSKDEKGKLIFNG